MPERGAPSPGPDGTNGVVGAGELEPGDGDVDDGDDVVALVAVGLVVVGVDEVVVVVADGSTPRPLSEMANASPSTSIVVVVDRSPCAAGSNV